MILSKFISLLISRIAKYERYTYSILILPTVCVNEANIFLDLLSKFIWGCYQNIKIFRL